MWGTSLLFGWEGDVKTQQTNYFLRSWLWIVVCRANRWIVVIWDSTNSTLYSKSTCLLVTTKENQKPQNGNTITYLTIPIHSDMDTEHVLKGRIVFCLYFPIVLLTYCGRLTGGKTFTLDSWQNIATAANNSWKWTIIWGHAWLSLLTRNIQTECIHDHFRIISFWTHRQTSGTRTHLKV